MITLADWRPTRYQKDLVNKVLSSRRLTYGDMTRKFEEEFARIHGWKYALFTSSGTDALKIALGALKEKYGWKDGDEIIIPAVTFIATFNVVLMNNLTPVLVDVQKHTVNLDPELIKKAITKKTVAIMPVHLLGQAANMPAIMKIALAYNLKVVEDSCETMFIDTKIKGQIACYSTYIAHVLVTGVGGFITTNDKKLATTMRSMMFHGRHESYLSMNDKTTHKLHYWFPRFGYSNRLTELEAALGLGELRDWQKMVIKRQKNAKYLMENLSFASIPVLDVNNHAFMFFPLFVKGRDKLIKSLDENGVQARLILPLTTQPTVKKYLKNKYPVAQWINRNGLLLPCHQYLRKQDLDKIISIIRSFCNV